MTEKTVRSRVTDFFSSSRLRIRVYFEYHDNIQQVRAEVIEHVRRLLNVIRVSKEEECDVKVVFCPIVSRAGTDIEAALSRLALEKPTVVFVLHHTFDPDYNAPSSSRYKKDNLMMVDILFHEDKGLLDCSKNNEAFSKTEHYINIYAKPQHVVVSNVSNQPMCRTTAGRDFQVLILRTVCLALDWIVFIKNLY